MATAAAQGLRQRLFGKRLNVCRFMARQDQRDGKRERRVECEQLAVAAEFQRRQPFGLAGHALTMVGMRGGRLMSGMLMMMCLRRLGRLNGRI